MIYELRTYTCYPGTVPKVLEMWKKEGKACEKEIIPSVRIYLVRGRIYADL